MDSDIQTYTIKSNAGVSNSSPKKKKKIKKKSKNKKISDNKDIDPTKENSNTNNNAQSNNNQIVQSNDNIIQSNINQAEKVAEVPAPSPKEASSSSFKSFLTSKKGIILLSLLGLIIVAAAVAIPLLLKKKKDEEEETVEENEEDIDTIDYSYIPMESLTQNNMVEYTKLKEYSRTPPSGTNFESFGREILYGGNNSELDSMYNDISTENNLLIASENTYDEIGADGKLYLNGNYIGRNLYKHIFSKGLYGGDVSDTEKAVSMQIRINPVSPTNYITGLYAPPGEVIKIEISEEDLSNIGGKVSFSIGQATQGDGSSGYKESIGIKRVLYLVTQLSISKTIGYIGSFLGGPIYISNPSIKKQFTLTISNAVPYKHILLGITTKEQFEKMESYSAPFFELDVRESIRYSGPASVIDGFEYDNLVKNLIFWDKCVRTSKQVPSGSNKNLGIHFLYDPYINAGGALALAYVGGNWCQVPLTFYLALDYETMTKYGAWGHIHELNHHFQKFGFYSTSNEVTNNIINLVEYILYSQISGLRNEFSNAAITKISGNHNYLNPEYSLKLLVDNPPTSQDEIRFYDPILIAFGPELFIKVTQYGQGSAGVDLFYESLVEVLHYDFVYYIEKILNLAISTDKKNNYQSIGYQIFIPVSSIYQTGRYFTIDGVEYFSNTSFPYRIPKGGPTKLDFENHIIIPTGFTCTIQSISNPEFGTLEKQSEKIYTYTPNDEHPLSGRIKLKLLLSNTAAGITSEVTLGLEFQIDNTQSVQTNYIFDSPIYTDLEEAMAKGYEGYSSIEYFPNFAGALTGIKEGNVGIWEGKFRIDDDGYKYITYYGGRGPSQLFAKINNETQYKKIGYIVDNQAWYMFVEPSYAYYQIDLSKGDIVYFKAYLLGYTISTPGGTANLRIGLAKEPDTSKVRTLDANDIVGADSEFDEEYEFYSGDPYFTEKEVDSLFFFDYSLVKISSPNFESWDGGDTFALEKLIDRRSDTYMHTKKNKKINSDNPLTIIFDLGRVYDFDYIYFIRREPNNYVPKKLTLSISNDNSEWNDIGEITTSQDNDISKVEIFLEEKISSRYVKMHITETTDTSTGYIALVSVEFIDKNLLYYQKTPEFAKIGNYDADKNNVVLNFNNFPFFGHSYILKEGILLKIDLENTRGIRVKVCNKYDSKIEMTINQNNKEIKKETLEIKASDGLDFPIIEKDLTEGSYSFMLSIKEGSLDLEYILSQVL